MRRGDPTYLGFYLVTYPGIARSAVDDEYEIDFGRKPQINGGAVEWNVLIGFYLGEIIFPSLFEDNLK